MTDEMKIRVLVISWVLHSTSTSDLMQCAAILATWVLLHYRYNHGACVYGLAYISSRDLSLPIPCLHISRTNIYDLYMSPTTSVLFRQYMNVYVFFIF